MFLLFSPILLCSLRRMRTPDASYAGQHLPAVRTLTYIKQIFIEAPRPRCEGFWFGFSMHQRTSAIMCYPLLELSSYHCSIAIWLCCASWQAKSGQQLHWQHVALKELNKTRTFGILTVTHRVKSWLNKALRGYHNKPRFCPENCVCVHFKRLLWIPPIILKDLFTLQTWLQYLWIRKI